MDETGLNMKRDGGINVLRRNDREAAENLLKQLADYGIFVVSEGELESWLKSLACTGHGPPWLVSIFEAMGGNPETPGYVRPTDDDVWEFLGRIKSWFNNPLRRGISD